MKKHIHHEPPLNQAVRSKSYRQRLIEIMQDGIERSNVELGKAMGIPATSSVCDKVTGIKTYLVTSRSEWKLLKRKDSSGRVFWRLIKRGAVA